MTKKNSLSRRDFFTTTAVVGAVGSIGASVVFASCAAGSEKMVPLQSLSGAYIPNLVDKASDGKPLKAGVIGCGGRGSGASRSGGSGRTGAARSSSGGGAGAGSGGRRRARP